METFTVSFYWLDSLQWFEYCWRLFWLNKCEKTTCFKSISASSGLSSSLCRALFLLLATCRSFCALSVNVDVDVCLCGFVCTCLTSFWRLLTSFSLHPVSLSLSLSIQWQLASAFPPTDQLSTLTRGIWIVCMCACASVCARMCVSVRVRNKRAALFFGRCLCLSPVHVLRGQEAEWHARTHTLGDWETTGAVAQRDRNFVLSLYMEESLFK